MGYFLLIVYLWWGDTDGLGGLFLFFAVIIGLFIYVTVKFIQPLLFIIFSWIGGGLAGSTQSQYGYQRHVKPEDLDFVAISLLCGLAIGCLLFKQYGYRHVQAKIEALKTHFKRKTQKPIIEEGNTTVDSNLLE